MGKRPQLQRDLTRGYGDNDTISIHPLDLLNFVFLFFMTSEKRQPLRKTK